MDEKRIFKIMEKADTDAAKKWIFKTGIALETFDIFEKWILKIRENPRELIH